MCNGSDHLFMVFGFAFQNCHEVFLALAISDTYVRFATGKSEVDLACGNIVPCSCLHVQMCVPAAGNVYIHICMCINIIIYIYIYIFIYVHVPEAGNVKQICALRARQIRFFSCLFFLEVFFDDFA